MPNQSGILYGLTILSPIIDDERATPSHDLQIRKHLAGLPTDQHSPFALAAGTHLARIAVMDDVIYVGMPSCEEHLKSKYLVFESNCDGDLEGYLGGLADAVPEQLDAIWSHCVGYPGAADRWAFIQYMKSCQLDTTFYFAAINNKTLPQALRALYTQHAVTNFIASHQGMAPAQLQAEFLQFTQDLASEPTPPAGSMGPHRGIKTGGRNE
ncbi:hypothetical protein [Granulicella tundricola]|uniref:Uncharacterized protein n=1 Tax=Granulicella tundricola (strain ATCC BAA-1859 / DSM 23138 / MP5ACTX9) TaxID=1198114 RepID=E8X5U4_GRATM|nr:hypothetical protein [Granulicella tundricola]ADW70828.1 hypothetical protein AciX9_4032 [Granulicella tundricola MP5ACTX9]